MPDALAAAPDALAAIPETFFAGADRATFLATADRVTFLATLEALRVREVRPLAVTPDLPRDALGALPDALRPPAFALPLDFPEPRGVDFAPADLFDLPPNFFAMWDLLVTGMDWRL
jgi:hypothetical protein